VRLSWRIVFTNEASGMSDPAWKKRERSAAALFGAMRQPLSGSSGRGDQTRSDSTHDVLFIETKTRMKSFVRALWKETSVLANEENKTPVLVLYEKSKPGGLIVIHEDDFGRVVDEWVKAKAQELAEGVA
jgi:hypothetical protein